MRSTSSEPVVLRDLPDTSLTSTGASPELRTGTWTRLAGAAALGDAATESVLGELAERSREAGRAQGYAAGWAEGRRRAQEVADRIATARAAAAEETRTTALEQQRILSAALEQAVAGCGSDLEARYAELAEQAVEVALRIAEAVVQRELSTTADPGADAVRRALTSVPPTAAVTVRLNPEDLAGLEADLLAGRPVTLVADATLERGDARAETETQVVDASVSAAMARVREVLDR